LGTYAKIMNQESALLVVLCFLVAGSFTLTNMMRKQRYCLRCLDIKLDALLKQQGVEWPSLSPEVQALAQDPSRKIAAIKLHRDEHPDVGLAEARAEIEAFTAKKQLSTPTAGWSALKDFLLGRG
jgi:hypothetical protein